MLRATLRAEIIALWDEHDAAAAPEARLAKALDKRETRDWRSAPWNGIIASRASLAGASARYAQPIGAMVSRGNGIRCLVGAVIATIVTACDSGSSVCAPIGGAAVTAEIRDSVTHLPLAWGGAVLEIREGTYVERTPAAYNAPDSLTLYAGLVRPGTYTVTVTRPGYVEWSRSNVTARKGACNGVDTVLLGVFLQPR
ncbi:MAG TPA: carboxypeptidase-like regulatory domain-containing protein [Gemmatimonadaceae bacterium]|nr:carboxypeptidase-like regulatory domain-containing protein [Gemmatimonadaceae bacterium]